MCWCLSRTQQRILSRCGLNRSSVLLCTKDIKQFNDMDTRNRLQVNSRLCLFICLIHRVVCVAHGNVLVVICFLFHLFFFYFFSVAPRDTCRYICFDTSVDLFGGAHVTHKIWTYKHENNTSKRWKPTRRTQQRDWARENAKRMKERAQRKSRMVWRIIRARIHSI